jgi:casein kinase II subunit beta
MRRSGTTSWVLWFLESPRGSIFIEIDEGYLNNNYNLYGIRQKVPHFAHALALIRGPYTPRERRPGEWASDIDDYGMCLYGLLHARYLLTDEGQQRMYVKYRADTFPKCPRMLCEGCRCLPYGSSDDIGQSEVRVFCPNCQDVYSVKDKRFTNMDGAFFGPTWTHLFVNRYSELVPKDPPQKYQPRIFGFRILPPENAPDH